MTIVKGIGIMKKRCKMIIALLSAAMVLTACAKNTSDTDSNKANDTKTQDTSKDRKDERISGKAGYDRTFCIRRCQRIIA